MHVTLDKELADKFDSSLEEGGFTELRDRLGIRKGLDTHRSTSIGVELMLMDGNALELLYGLAKEAGDRATHMAVKSYQSIITEPESSRISSLKMLIPGLITYLKKHYIKGYLFKVDESGNPEPYLVHKMKYDEGDRRTKEAPSVTVTLLANSLSLTWNSRTERCESGDGSMKTFNIHFNSNDIAKAKVPELLANEGFVIETEDLHEAHAEHLRLFQQYQPMEHQQFRCTGKALMQTGNSWSRNIVDLSPEGTKAVNEESLAGRKFVPHASREFWEKHGVEEGFDEIPYHCHLLMYNLDLHDMMRVHVANVRPYEYKPELRDKLVLPSNHRDLIEILATDMDVLMDDIVDGKSGGTTILCVGEPGLGKTLTAEVYSEVIKRPLFRVHSGLLGISPEAVSKNLKYILDRAQRWGAVLLLDEADVYIRARGNDIEHNAVVAEFLRTLEYFSGLLFMTTNRSKDVDDAILSRCIAVVKYELPSPEDAKAIWQVLSKQFDLDLGEALINGLVEAFPKASGRDIKELLKLTSKWVRRRDISFSVDAFRQCGQFRGL